MAIQINKRSQLLKPRPAIRSRLTIMPRIGTRGTSGVRNGRGSSGWVLPHHHDARADNHESQQRSDARHLADKLNRHEGGEQPTKTMKIMLQRQGVRNFGWMSENSFGSRPSRDME